MKNIDEIKKLLKKYNIDFNKNDTKNLNELSEKIKNLEKKIKNNNEKINLKNNINNLFQIENTKTNKIFPNNIIQNSFGIARVFADRYTKILNSSEEFNQYTIDKFGNDLLFEDLNDNRYHLEDNADIEFYFKDKLDFVNLESLKRENSSFFKIIHDNYIKSGTFIQHVCGLWNFALKQNSLYFEYVPINKILHSFKKIKKKYFDQETRKSFTKSIKLMESIFLRSPIKKNKKKEYIWPSLGDFRYSTTNKEGNVILSLYGRLLDPEVNVVGRAYPKSLFNFILPNQANSFLYAFKIATRFSQKENYKTNNNIISWPKHRHILRAGLKETSIANKTVANKRLLEMLLQLENFRCIEGFEPRTIPKDDEEIINIYKAS